MYIEKITINNYRIYYGENTVTIAPVSNRNVSVISGDNGYGKTTFLTALVWCLYGNQMQEIDSFYKDRILAAGGYKKYLASSMNRRALANGETKFHVSIDLKKVELPGIQCDSIQISRACNITNLSDVLTIFMDNRISELVDDVGQQVFIHDFILPKEIAKFFFFDAEKIVEIAEIQSLQEKQLLSQAYSEVLGIKKYEDLKNSLNDLRIRFRKDSANDIEKAQFKDLGEEINRLTKSIRRKEQKKEKLISERGELRIKSDTSQEKLLREGNTLTLSEIHELQDEKSRLYEDGKALMSEFKDLFEYVPFAITGKILAVIESQLDIEDKHRKSFIDKKLLRNKINTIIDNLERDTSDISQKIDNEIKDYYLTKVHELLNRHLIEAEQEVELDNVMFLHDFPNDEKNRFKAILSNLRTTYREKLQVLNRSLRMNRAAYSDVSRKLAYAESIELDELVKSYRMEKESIDRHIRSIDEETLELSQNIGALENSLIAKKRLFEEIARKIKVNEKHQDKDKLATRLIEELGMFIMRIKAEKKNSLEERVLSNLNMLMHKKDFIHRVIVEINSDILDIHLIDRRGKEIRKDDLSKGEQQLYATAILEALVEESGIDFPVFVDSPLQKFDDKHSRNIITGFYPQISKQVVIFPLLNKELSEEEYGLLIEHVGSAFIINNFNEDSSGFREVSPHDLFNKGSKVGAAIKNA